MSYRDSWHSQALKSLSVLAHQNDYLTSDDLHDFIGDPPRHHNQTGAVINDAVQLGVLVETGRYVKSRRPSAKSRTIKLFKSGFHHVEPTLDPVTDYLKQVRPQSEQSALFA